MASFLCDNVLDFGLDYLDDHGSRLDICSALPATYGQATTDGAVSLGNKVGISIAAPTNRGGGGRECVISAIADGTVTDTNTATHWAITDGAAELIAAGVLSAPQVVTDGNVFTLTQFAIGIPDAV